MGEAEAVAMAGGKPGINTAGMMVAGAGSSPAGWPWDVVGCRKPSLPPPNDCSAFASGATRTPRNSSCCCNSGQCRLSQSEISAVQYRLHFHAAAALLQMQCQLQSAVGLDDHAHFFGAGFL